MSADSANISAFLDVVNVSRETIARLELYESLILKWNPAINLVSKSTLSEIWGRHFLDSAQIWNCKPPNAKRWLDMGSGGGFPGLVIAIIADELAPDLQVILVESDARKASFLMKLCQETGIRAKIHIERIENLSSQDADVISARALAPTEKLLDYASRHAREGAKLLFSKGANHEIELTEARKYWKFKLQKTTSLTDPSGVILEIEGLSRV